jgi:hypothetical protein
MKKSCDLQPMARSGIATVEFCRDCQVFHVNLGRDLDSFHADRI